MTQLGPASMQFTFEPGCVYRSAARGLLGRFNEDGNYRVEGATIVFQRADGSETRWPYQVEEGKLFLQESAVERHEYARQ